MKKWFICALAATMAALLLSSGSASSLVFAGAGARQQAGARQSSANVRQPFGKAMARNARHVGKLRIGERIRRRAENQANETLALGSASVLVLDQMTGVPLLEKQAGKVMPIASISKLMTAMVALDAAQNMEEVILIAAEDASMPRGARSHLPVGISMTRDTALLLALMSSENRAANALGRNYPGGMKAFVAAMNDKARALGLRHTRFVEPTGLSLDNVSTARDLAYLVMAAHQYPKIREYSTMAGASIDMGDRVLEFVNTNALVNNPQWRIGLSKTGYLSAAGRCLVMQAWVAGKPVVMVLLDSTGKMTRVGDANRIRRWMEGDATPENTDA
ncbi:MAG: D-alanyl-D-alanine endopeptidase [Zoogloeaceae bacterium]|nr:D-alanyl-D-alanine endopeptidase [Zoogloeaceae bacterium]